MEIIAFVVENEVCNLIHFQQNHSFENRYINGLSSNPIFINCSNYPSLKSGDFYINGNFYKKDDLEKLRLDWLKQENYTLQLLYKKES